MAEAIANVHNATVRLEGNTAFVEGALDFDSVTGLADQVNRWIADTSGTVHIDLAAVQFCNSAGITLLLEWMRNAHQHGKQLQMHHLPADLLAMAEVSGLSSVFTDQSV